MFQKPSGTKSTLDLSVRQMQVADLVARGYSNREIARELSLTEQVVKNVLHRVFDRLGIWNRVELANRLLDGGRRQTLEESQERIEYERISELQRRQVLDSAAEQIFDELTNIAVSIFNVPIALVGLLDSKRLWFKSSIGLKVTEVPRELTICHHTIRQSQVLVVSNAPEDSRFACNPLIQEVGVQFYAAAPILTDDGYALGVVCIVDRIPRHFSAAHLSVLTSLAHIAMQQLDARLQLLEGRPACRAKRSSELRSTMNVRLS